MRIVYFVGILDQIGGAELATRRLAQCMTVRGHEVTILTTRALRHTHFPLIDYAKLVRIMRLPVWQRSPAIFRTMLQLQAAWAFPMLLRGTDIFQARGLLPESAALARFARRFGAKTVCVPMASGALGDVAAYRGIIPFQHVSALTEPSRKELSALGYPSERTGVTPNGVDAAFFHPSDAPCDAPNVVYIGQYRPEKRIDLLLAAWIRLQATRPDAALTLVGGSQMRHIYQRSAASNGVRATFVADTDATGVRDQLWRHSIFVMPGIAEGMSNALLEAMAVGLAPVAADTPANRALIVHEDNGLLYPPDSAEALACAIERLICDAGLRRRLGAAARSTVLSRFTLDRVADQYQTLYATLLGETR